MDTSKIICYKYLLLDPRLSLAIKGLNFDVAKCVIFFIDSFFLLLLILFYLLKKFFLIEL